MARRYQIIRKTGTEVARATVNTEAELRELVELLKADPEVKYIVVKDRTTRTRGMVWRRGDEAVDWWILDKPQPEITFKKKPRF